MREMETSIFLAKFLGCYMLILALAIIINRGRMKVIMADLANSPGALFILSVITLVMGLLLVLVHSVWAMDWRVIITVYAWIVVLQGGLRLFFPEFMSVTLERFGRNDGLLLISALVMLGLSGFFLWHGFW